MPRPNRGIYLVDKPRLLPSGTRVWVARWFEGGRKREHILGPGSKSEAEGRIVAFRKEREASAKGKREPEHYPIAHALTNYAREHAPAKASRMTISYNIDALTPFFGKMMVSEITPETCRKYAKQRGKKNGTIARELTTLGAALQHDVKEGRLTSAPFIHKPKQAKAKDRWLTKQEAAALLRAARTDQQSKGHLPRFILLALYTAARKGAILDLGWNQIDLERERLDLNPEGRIETSKGRAKLPIPRRLLTMLRYWRARAKKGAPVVAIAGRPVGSIKKSFKAACDRAKLKSVTPHTLRHTAATWMAQAGVPMGIIGAFLGQSEAHTTARYIHHHPDHLKAAAAALNRRQR